MAAGPVKGVLVDDATYAIRPVVVAPGEAHTGSASVRGSDYAVVAPDGRTALVVRDGLVSVVRRVESELPVWRTLTEDPIQVDRAVWSDDANAVAIFDAKQYRLFFWKNVQSDAQPAGSCDLSTLTSAPVTMALDPGASVAFATTQEKDGASLIAMPLKGVAETVLTLGKVGPLIFRDGTLYVADRGRAEVVAVTNWNTGLSVRTVVSAGQGISDPIGIAISQDNKQILVADASSKQVLAFELSSSAQKGALQLDFRPTRMEPIGSGTLFLLQKGTPGETPAHILQTPDLQLLNVPVAAGEVDPRD
jgi:DNA-binding beta-propeller fold protein YncE